MFKQEVNYVTPLLSNRPGFEGNPSQMVLSPYATNQGVGMTCRIRTFDGRTSEGPPFHLNRDEKTPLSEAYLISAVSAVVMGGSVAKPAERVVYDLYWYALRKCPFFREWVMQNSTTEYRNILQDHCHPFEER